MLRSKMDSHRAVFSNYALIVSPICLCMLSLGCAQRDDAGVESDTAQNIEQAQQPEAHSLFGEPLAPMALDDAQRTALEARLFDAKADFDLEPSEENVIWYGRRLAYLWRYQQAIDVFSAGLERYPDSYKLYRHRGHRFITVRELDKAIEDFERAVDLIDGVPDEIEQDGAPNEAGIPRSSSHSNIWYHLGLAYYLTGQFEKAADAYEHCLEFSSNDDMLIATLDWQYMTLRRLGRDDDAESVLEPVNEQMDILENHSYHRRLLMYKGSVEAEQLLASDGASALDLATQGYGVANWHWVNGDQSRATAILEQILEGDYWAAFGYIAAEADLKRIRQSP